MPHLESKTKLIMTASVNRYINPYFNQQHKQLDLTTIAPKTTHWALRDLLKTIVANRVVNYRQFGGVFGLSWKNALGALATQNKN